MVRGEGSAQGRQDEPGAAKGWRRPEGRTGPGPLRIGCARHGGSNTGHRSGDTDDVHGYRGVLEAQAIRGVSKGIFRRSALTGAQGLFVLSSGGPPWIRARPAPG
ncbi:hypothetical protein GCM10009603_53380 [Nocardiopsis exhalans]